MVPPMTSRSGKSPRVLADGRAVADAADAQDGPRVEKP